MDDNEDVDKLVFGLEMGMTLLLVLLLLVVLLLVLALDFVLGLVLLCWFGLVSFLEAGAFESLRASAYLQHDKQMKR